MTTPFVGARGRRAALLVVLGVASLEIAWSDVARAEEDAPSLRAEADRAGSSVGLQRPFAFVTDPSTPGRGSVELGYSFGFASGISADRPLPVSMASTTGSHSFRLGYGITSRFAPYVSAALSESPTGSGKTTADIAAGATFQVTSPDAPFRLSLSAAGIHETESGANGFSALASASYDVRDLRVAGNARADKLFGSNRDSVDLFALLGVSYRVMRGVRVGAEYVAQDLEDAFEEDEEGGLRHALGPTVAIDLENGRYQIVVAAAFGLNAISPRALVRAGLTASF